ncbi:MAG: leucyl aminopeptidase [Halothiobacillaceae bacterium]|nr:leucyl aminopeptidase [Halothiobacillaceae bacterium]
MDYSIRRIESHWNEALVSLHSDCLVVGVYSNGELTPSAAALDQLSGGMLTRLVARGDLDMLAGKTLLIPSLSGVSAERVLLVCLGVKEEIKLKRWKNLFSDSLNALQQRGVVCVDFALLEAAPQNMGQDMSQADALRHAVLALDEASYRFLDFKSDKIGGLPSVQQAAFLVSALVSASDEEALETALAQSKAIALGVELTKNLANTPSNVCTPNFLAETAQQLAAQSDTLKVEILEQADMQQLAMGSLLSVAQGSDQPPKFIVLDYRNGAADTAPVVLVGKGVTFDSGGISLKPGEKMDEMKYDMGGAAAVLGVFKAVADMQLAINLIGLIPAVENMPSGGALKPGDIVTSMSGQTIEVLNTDAEGRLILCDALTYAERFQPAAVIDMATLTGACVIALARAPSGLLGNNPELVQSILKAGETSGDRAWELPLWDDYQDLLKSNFADMANIGGREGGAITAAAFLSRFTKAYPWAHLDIAGTAWNSGDKKGATGRPVPLVMQWLMARVNQ